jgi:hypothetical protein
MATLEELRNQYYADLLKSGQELITNLPQLPKETVQPISDAEKQALDLARTDIANRPDFLNMGVGSLLSGGFQQAQRAAMQAFENQQRRGQLAAQNLANIGRTQTGIGQVFGQFDPIASGVTERDVSTLARIGATERGIGQSDRAAEFANLMRSYNQPFTAMQFQSGMLGGFPTYAESQQAQLYNPLFTGIQSLFG